MASINYRAAVVEYVTAMKSVRCAKNVFFLLLVLAILTQLAAFAVINFTDKLDAAYRPADRPGAPAAAPATSPARTRAAADADAPDAIQAAVMYKHSLGAAMKVARFVAPVAAALATVCLFIGLIVTLIGRLDGAAGLSGALFWSLLLIALLVPWQQASSPAVGLGAMSSLEELATESGRVVKGWGHEVHGSWDHVLFYARFVGYPVVALLVWLVMQSKFARGYKRMIASTVVDAGTEEPTEPEPAETPEQ